MTDELKQWEYDKGYTKGYSDGRASLIEELEKIKADFEELAFLLDDLSPDKEFVVALDDIKEVIDNHISELKGENK